MSSIINPAQVEAAFEKALKPAIARWVIPGWLNQGVVNQAIVAGDIYYIPIFVPERTLYDRIGVYVASGDGVGGAADLRIFRSVGGLPDILVLSAGALSTNASGAQELVISETLERGYYFLALRGDQAPSLRGMQSTGAVRTAVPGFQINNASAISFCVLDVTGAYADPARAPTGGLGAEYAFVKLREA